jgi:molybdenum cofactor biosynthesis protein MoaC
METTRRFQPWADESAFQMINITEKEVTRRRAVARGTIHLAPDAFTALRNGTNPKGDVLKLAEIAGIQAAKQTSQLLPLCHPLALESVRIHFKCHPDQHSVTVFCDCALTGKTGVEMEALSGVNGALLAIYDLSKAVNPVLAITDVRLEIKEGGKSGKWIHPESSAPEREHTPELLFAGIRSAVLTISDRCSRGEAEDRSGPHLKHELTRRGAEILHHGIVADDIEDIRKAVMRIKNECNSNLIVTTGGTGISPRDVTPEALAPLWNRKLPGFGELLRAYGSRQTELSWLSRSEAGLIGETLVILLPGSPKAVEDGICALERLIPHTLSIAQGGGH